MKLLNLRATNFRTFTKTQEVGLQGIRAAVIGGPNGAGKSSFFIDAILFALWGEARNKPEGLVNDTFTEAEVSLLFEHNTVVYEVVRLVKKATGKQELKLFEHKMGTQISLSERLLTGTQKKLDDILGFSHDLLISTAVAQQGEIDRLSEMTPGEREKIVTEMLGIGIWEKKKKLIQEQLLALKKDEDSIDDLELHLDAAIGRITEIIAEKGLLEEELLPLTTSRTLHHHQLLTLETKFKERENYGNLQAKVAEITAKVNQMKQRLTQLGSIKDPGELRFKLQDVINDIIECDDLLGELDKATGVIRVHLNALQSNKVTAQKWAASKSNFALLDRVPCKGLDIHSICELLAHARETRQGFLNFQNTITHIAPTVELYIEKLEQMERNDNGELSSFEASRKDLNDRKFENAALKSALENEILAADETKKLNAEVTHWSQELRVQQNALDALPKVSTDELISTRQTVAHLDNQINELKIKINQKEVELAGLDRFKNESEVKIEAFKDVKKKAAMYRTLQTAYTDIPTLLFADIIPYLEGYTNQILAQIAPERRVQLRAYKSTKAGTQQKALDVIGTTPTGIRDFSDLSGSEKFRQSLALRVALSKVNAELYNTQIGFFICDEGLGSLDQQNTVLMKTALRKVADSFDLFLVISHVPEFEDTFDTRILVSTKSEIQVLNQKASSEVALDT